MIFEERQGKWLKQPERLEKQPEIGENLNPEEEDMILRLGGERHIVDISVGYKEGDRVTITEGPLTGLESQIKTINRTKRTAVLLVTLMSEIREINMGLVLLNK